MKQEKTLLQPNVKWPVSVRLLRPFRFALIMLGVLSFMSCRTVRTLMPQAGTDSTKVAAKAEIRQVSVIEPARLDTAAEMSITPAQIDSLPEGAEYSVQTSQARATLRKGPKGSVTLSAQGISPAKVKTETDATSGADARNVKHHKPPEVYLKDDKRTFKWWPDRFILGSILFAILSISCLFWSVTQKRK